MSTYERSAQEVTLTFSTAHPFLAGDFIDVTGSNSADVDGLEYFITSVVNDTETDTYTLTYAQITGELLADIPNTNPSATMTVNLSVEDVLEIDTYLQEVSFVRNTNVSNLGYRFYINTLADWITLQAGGNNINLSDDTYVAEAEAGYIDVYYRSGWIG